MKTVFYIIVAIVVIVVALSIVFSTKSDTLKIGVAAPLSGDLAMYGKSMQAALELSADNLGNKIGGKEIEFIFEDSKCNAAEATKVFNKLENVDNVDIFMSACSADTLAGAQITEPSKKLHFTSCGTSQEINGAGKYLFALMPLDDAQGEFMANYIYDKLGIKETALLVCLNEWCKGNENSFRIAYEKKGGVIKATEFNKEEEIDFKAQLSKVEQANVKIIIAMQYPEAFIKIVKQARELGINTPMMVPNIFTNKEIISELGPSLEGYYGITNNAYVKLNGFEDELKKRSGLDIVDVEYCSGYSYDALQIINSIVEKTSSFDSDEIKKELISNKYVGIMSSYDFSENGIQKSGDYKILQYRGGKLEEVG